MRVYYDRRAPEYDDWWLRTADVEPVRREDRVLKDGTSWTVSFVFVRA